jgi:hypothetical protein
MINRILIVHSYHPLILANISLKSKIKGMLRLRLRAKVGGNGNGLGS